MTRSERLAHIKEWTSRKGDWPAWVADDAAWLLGEVERLEKARLGAMENARRQLVRGLAWVGKDLPSPIATAFVEQCRRAIEAFPFDPVDP